MESNELIPARVLYITIHARARERISFSFGISIACIYISMDRRVAISIGLAHGYVIDIASRMFRVYSYLL